MFRIFYTLDSRRATFVFLTVLVAVYLGCVGLAVHSFNSKGFDIWLLVGLYCISGQVKRLIEEALEY